MPFELKITADTADELVLAFDAFHDAIAGRKPSEAKPETADAPKGRGRESKADSAPADGAASEPSSPNTSVLEPADEGNAGASSATTSENSPVESPATASPSEPAGPTRDDALTAATKFSQEHGVEKLEKALEAVGAKKFSDIPAYKYGAFIAEMEKAGKSASALS